MDDRAFQDACVAPFISRLDELLTSKREIVDMFVMMALFHISFGTHDKLSSVGTPLFDLVNEIGFYRRQVE
ncbi:hypothetical protein, partial [Campylobacter jejuni]|uniref:hypothetical protein n=1 Tax=Campylobacter jejuni TaxID=197 RepID=UPI001E654FEC